MEVEVQNELTLEDVNGIDPRCLVTSRLPTTYPLPYISRRALSRVKDHLNPPQSCCCCGGIEIHIVSNSQIYRGKEYGNWPYVYLCMDCGARVGLHPGTDLPLGTLADKKTREERKRAKEMFYLLMFDRFKNNRREAYAWLARQLEMDPRLCHFGMFTISQCREVQILINQNLKRPRNVLD